jgi:hypothetical protein
MYLPISFRKRRFLPPQAVIDWHAEALLPHNVPPRVLDRLTGQPGAPELGLAYSSHGCKGKLPSMGGNVEQSGSASGFREVDQDGNPVAEHVQAASAEDSTDTGPFAVNPFIIVLWLMAALLVIGGTSALLNANLALGPSSGAMPLPFVIFTLAPHAILGGIIAIIFLLLWHANQWQHRRGQRPHAGPVDGRR